MYLENTDSFYEMLKYISTTLECSKPVPPQSHGPVFLPHGFPWHSRIYNTLRCRPWKMPIYEPISYREPLLQLRWATQCFKCFLEARASQAGETNKTCPKIWALFSFAYAKQVRNSAPHAVPKTQPRPTSWQSEAGKNYVSWVLFSTCNWSKLIVIAFLIAFLSFSCLDQWLCEQPASSSPCTATVTLKELFCVSATSTSSEMARYSSRALTDHWYIWYIIWYIIDISWYTHGNLFAHSDIF